MAIRVGVHEVAQLASVKGLDEEGEVVLVGMCWSHDTPMRVLSYTTA